MWQNGTMTDLLGTRGAHAVAINDLGQLVGSYRTSSDGTHAYLWENGTVTDLRTLAGRPASPSASTISVRWWARAAHQATPSNTPSSGRMG
jgi:probable HAF family extracellular repeat protein